MTTQQQSINQTASVVPDIVYKVLHPSVLFVVTPVIITVTLLGFEEASKVLVWAGLLAVLFAIPTYLIYTKSGEPGSSKVKINTMLAGTVGMGISLVVAMIFNAPWELQVCVIAGLVGVIASLLVQKFFAELSLHALMLAGVATVALYTSLITGLVMLPLTLLSSWAVVAGDKAPLNEVVRGWALVSITTLVVFVIIF